MRIAAVLAFIAGAALASVLLIYAGLAPITHALARFGLVGLIIVILAHVPVIALLGGAWWLIGRGAGEPRVALFIWARAVRDAAAEALPLSQVGGYVIGARALMLSGADAARAGLSTLLDLTLEFAAKIPYIVLGLLTLAWLRPRDMASSLAIAALIAAVALLVVLWAKTTNAPAEKIARLLARWPRLSDLQSRLAALIGEMTSHRAAVRGGALLHFVCWLIGAGETWLVFHFMHVPVGVGPALVIDSVVGGIRAISFFVPGALGVQEGSYVLFCGLFGISPGAALALSLVRRARDLFIAAPILLSWQWREGHAVLFPQRFKS